MKFWKLLTISIISSIITLVLSTVAYTFIANAAEGDDSPLYKNPSFGFTLVSSSYHFSMNDYFNEKMEILNTILEKDDFAKDVNFNAPADDKCTDTNVSSYCVSMGALDMYFEYLESLAVIRKQLPVREESNAIWLSDLYQIFTTRNSKLDQEVDDAKEVMEATIAAYHEYRLAYPMHREYENIIESLLKYKLALREVSKRVSKFPGKFIDASSVYCE